MRMICNHTILQYIENIGIMLVHRRGYRTGPHVRKLPERSAGDRRVQAATGGPLRHIRSSWEKSWNSLWMALWGTSIGGTIITIFLGLFFSGIRGISPQDMALVRYLHLRILKFPLMWMGQRNPASVDRWYITVYPCVYSTTIWGFNHTRWCRISQPSTESRCIKGNFS